MLSNLLILNAITNGFAALFEAPKPVAKPPYKKTQISKTAKNDKLGHKDYYYAQPNHQQAKPEHSGQLAEVVDGQATSKPNLAPVVDVHYKDPYPSLHDKSYETPELNAKINYVPDEPPPPASEPKYALPSNVQLYGADLATVKWVNTGSRIQCSMAQKIPGYGQAKIIANAGESASFHLSNWSGLLHSTEAKLFAVPPSWKWDGRKEYLAKVKLDKGTRIVKLGPTLTKHVIDSLRNGYFPTMKYEASGEKVDVAVSSVNFSAAYQNFLDCLHTLLPANYQALKSTQIIFPSSGIILSTRAREHIKTLAEYARNNFPYDQIIIHGHSDNRGSRAGNRYISLKRANAVKAYLLELGVPKDKIKVINHGQKHPAYDNDTDEGRAKNRRVVIEIKRY